MTGSTSGPIGVLERVAERLYVTPPSPFPFMDGVELRSFVLDAADGPVVVYNTRGIDAVAEEIHSLGAPGRLLMNHWHEGMSGSPALGVRPIVHERDRSAAEHSMRIDETFAGRTRIGDDLELIPSLAHTPGAAFFLWDDGEHRVLFVGDSIWVEDGVWRAVVLEESSRTAFLATIDLLEELDFDRLAPWPTQPGTPQLVAVDPETKSRQLRGLRRRIAGGASGSV